MSKTENSRADSKYLGAYVSFYEHLAELFWRLFYVLAGSVAAGIVGFLLSAKVIRMMFALIAFVSPGNQVHPVLPSDRLLTAALIGLLGFHYIFLTNIWAYVSPGLYPDERKTFIIPLIWAKFAPLITLVFLAVYVRVTSNIIGPQLIDVRSLRAWLVKFYLITVLSTFLMALPRQKRTLTTYVYGAVSVLIVILPGHVFDTFTVLSSGVLVVLSIGSGLLLIFWSNADVRRAVEKYEGSDPFTAEDSPE